MGASTDHVEQLVRKEYEHGFVTEIDADTAPPGLDEDVVRFISERKGEPEWMLEWRLEAYRHWLNMREPKWAHVHHEPLDYQAISYYSAPKTKREGPKSLEEVDPKLLETYKKLGIPLEEQKALAGVAVDAVFDSVSVATPGPPLVMMYMTSNSLSASMNRTARVRLLMAAVSVISKQIRFAGACCCRSRSMT